MSGLLTDKVALVTGGASGIGRATALAMAREGAAVVVSDIDSEGGNETANRIRKIGSAAFLYSDVTDTHSVDALINETVDLFGRLDCAVNNAGVSNSGGVRTHETPEADYDFVMNVNLKGVWLCMRRQIRQMLAQGSGSIVNMASGGGLVGVHGLSAYTASKHGVVGLTKTAAIEYAADGIRVNCVCPGYVKTSMTRHRWVDPERLERMIAKEPIGRLGEPHEVAAAVVWLSSEAASFVTGHPMVVDGGYVAL